MPKGQLLPKDIAKWPGSRAAPVAPARRFRPAGSSG